MPAAAALLFRNYFVPVQKLNATELYYTHNGDEGDTVYTGQSKDVQINNLKGVIDLLPEQYD
eukprot:3932449-Rhodomonas_salina.1